MRLQELQQREVEILLLSCSGASLGFSFLALLVSAVFFWGFPCFPAPAFSPALPPSITLSIRPPAPPPSIPPSLHPSLKENGSRIQSRARNIRDPAWLETKKKRQGYKKCDKTTPAASFVPRGILRVTFNHFAALVVSHGSVFWYLIFVWTSVSLHDTLSVLAATSKSYSSFYIYIGWWIIH